MDSKRCQRLLLPTGTRTLDVLLLVVARERTLSCQPAEGLELAVERAVAVMVTDSEVECTSHYTHTHVNSVYV